MKKVFIVMIAFFPFFLSAVIGPNVSTLNGQELKWEDGQYDYFVMFKSLIEQVTGETTKQDSNPQADSCIDIDTGSTFTLTPEHIPSDAYVERAFLIWIAAHDPEKFHNPTDNSATLSFTNSEMPELTLSTEVTSDINGDLFPFPLFEYEAISSDDDKSGLFTYRVDVTEFMKDIIKSGAEKDIKSSGDSLYGVYNVKGLDCTNNEIYITTSGMVAGWALVFVYTSQKIRPKNIYFYNGMDAYRFSENVLDINGFELPDKAEIKLTMIVAEGDAGLASATTDAFQAAPPEGLSLKGQSVANFDFLYNICNPSKYTPLNYIEVYNSISSVYGWSDETPVCVGGDPLKPDPEGLEYAIDVDTFLIKAGEYPLKEGDTSFSIKISTNQDQIYTNLLILGVETKIEEEVQDSDDAESSDYDNNSNDEENLIEDPDYNSEESDDVANDKEENNDEYTDENKKK